MPPLYLSDIEYTLGEIRPIEEIPRLARDPMALRYLKNLGMASYSKLSGPMLDVLRGTAGKFLASSGLRGQDVDAVIFFSTMFDIYAEHSDLALLCHELGFDRAVPYGVFLNQCTNYTQAIQFGGHLIRSDGMRRVLLLGADRLDDARSDRVMPNNTSIYSDVAVCCLLSGEPRGGYAVDLMRHKYVPEMAKIMAGNDIIAFIENYSRGMAGACEAAYRDAGVEPSGIRHLVSANYNHSVLKNIAQLAKIPESRLFKGNVAAMGHCFSADHLISLRALADSGAARSGDRLNLVAVGGFWIFSSTLVTKA